MFAKRDLNDNELAFVASQIKYTKKTLTTVFVLLIGVIILVAIGVYSEIDAFNFYINTLFGVLILLLYGINWFIKGFKHHEINPEVHKTEGIYKRIYESYGRSGRYFDTINGRKVKIPWHWRGYLKSQKDTSISYEYILRDGAVAVNDGASIYVVSINDKLSLDFEIRKGLQKVRPISLVSIISMFLLMPAILMFSFSNDLATGLQISQLSKTADQPIILNSSESLNTITSANYIKIDNAWVYHYKRNVDVYGENYVISKEERDRIYEHPNSNMDYRYFLPSKALSKPDENTFKKNLEEQLKNSPLYNTSSMQNLPDSILKNTIDREYKRRNIDFENRFARAQKAEIVLEQLKPKTTILKICDDCFNAPKEKMYSIKKSLEHTFKISGFYDPNKKSVVSMAMQEIQRDQIKNAFVSVCILSFIALLALIGLAKISYNSYIKIKLVKTQLIVNDGTRRLER